MPHLGNVVVDVKHLVVVAWFDFYLQLCTQGFGMVAILVHTTSISCCPGRYES